MGVPTFPSPVGAIIRRVLAFAAKKFRLLLLRRNARNHFVHWRLPLFLFLDEIPHHRDFTNHFAHTSFFILHPTSRRLALRVRRSFSLLRSFPLWSYIFHSLVPPYFLSSLSLTTIYFIKSSLLIAC